MAKKKLSTRIIFVQDETGSMSAIEEQTREAFNEYFNTLKGDAKKFGKVVVQIFQFSETHVEDRVRSTYEGTLAKVPTLTAENYRPRGVTPLLDAVGTAIRGAEAAEEDRILFIVQTDGLENASKDFTRASVEKLVREKEEAENWTLVFLGAGINEWVKEVIQMGGQAGSTTSYKPHQTVSAYAHLAQGTGAMMQSGSLSAPTLAHDTQRAVEEEETSVPS